MSSICIKIGLCIMHLSNTTHCLLISFRKTAFFCSFVYEISVGITESRVQRNQISRADEALVEVFAILACMWNDHIIFSRLGHPWDPPSRRVCMTCFIFTSSNFYKVLSLCSSYSGLSSVEGWQPERRQRHVGKNWALWLWGKLPLHFIFILFNFFACG